MRTAVALRSDFEGSELRRRAKIAMDAGQARRLLALAEIYDGGSRTDAARIGDVGLQTIRDWVLRFNTRGPDGLIDGKAPGNRPKLDDQQRKALAEIVTSGPVPAIHGVVRWRLKDLAQWIFDEFGLSLSETTVSRQLKALGFRKLSARPRHHAQNEAAIEAFKKPPGRVGQDQSAPAGRRRPRSVVAGRGPHRPEDHDHPALGPTRHPPACAA